jgi:hypothetical protein
MTRTTGLCALVICVIAGIAAATVPATLSYQGLLKDSSGLVIPDGTYSLTFRLYNQASGGTVLWSEVQSLAVTDGVFSAVLGSVTALTLPFDATYWISLQVAGNPELPRVVLTSAPYALRAGVAEALTGGSGDITAVYADNGLTGGATSGEAHVAVGAGVGVSVTADAVAVDGTAIAGAGLVAEGASAVAVNPGIGLAVAADQVRLGDIYVSGTAYDSRFVNEAQQNSVTADMVTPNIVSSLDGVVNDGGNIDLIAGANVTITPDDGNNTITIASTGGGGGIGGSGTAGYVPKFTAGTTIGNSLLYDTGSAIGIGTTTPLSKLSLGTDLNPKKLALWDGAGDFYGLGVELGRITLYTANAERMTLLNNGFLGLNTPTPVTIIDVQGPTNYPTILRLNQTGIDGWSGLRLDREGYEKWFVGQPNYADNFVVRRSASIDAFVIDTGGCVGLGTNSPQTSLHMRNPSSQHETTIRMEIDDGSYWDFRSRAGGLDIGSNHQFDLMVLRNTGLSIGSSVLSGETKVHIHGTSDDFGVLVDAEGSVGSSIGLHAATSGYSGLAKNAYFNGLWQRFDANKGAFLQQVAPDGKVEFYTATSGTNPITWAKPLTLNTDGTAECSVLRITGGSDLAESFDIDDASGVEPGTVVSIHPARPGRLRVADRAYDRCVAGIVSGAGDVRPGMTMGQSGTLANGRHPVALSGRVYCRAVAVNGAIVPGDLLSTSDTPGCAMKVTDPARAQGAILGKAMSGLPEGSGLILVLVTLQ